MAAPFCAPTRAMNREAAQGCWWRDRRSQPVVEQASEDERLPPRQGWTKRRRPAARMPDLHLRVAGTMNARLLANEAVMLAFRGLGKLWRTILARNWQASFVKAVIKDDFSKSSAQRVAYRLRPNTTSIAKSRQCLI